jgi:predicted transcriptional regulator
MPFFFENEKQPVTALFDEDGNQLFETVGILEMSTSPSNTFAEHTLEDGRVVIDNKITNRVLISVTAILSPDDFKQAYAKIKDSDKNNTNFTIQNRVDTFSNMYIESYPYSESSAISNTIAININFIEQQFVASKVENLSPSKVTNQSDADTINSGQKLPKEQSTTLLDLLSSAGIF